jgi:hypothetical protein
MVLCGLAVLACTHVGCGERTKQPSTATSASPKAVAAPKPPTGFRLDSVPSGAAVLVDDRSVGVTPVSVTDLRPGLHLVHLDLAGFPPWETQVVVTEGVVLPIPAARLREGGVLRRPTHPTLPR